MPKHWIKNWEDVAVSKEREFVLKLGQAGLDAIDTEQVMQKQIKLKNSRLSIGRHSFNLDKFKNVYVLAFGKASAKAAEVLEGILGNKITNGVVVSTRQAKTKKIQAFLGTHPLPSLKNVKASEAMQKLIDKISKGDLVICLISGGGSALLCWSKKEYEQGVKLYNSYLKTGGDIIELNTVRKHISKVKGGGLAKMLYPARVVGLVFSDIAGGRDNLVDSGPTFFDNSTIADAKKVIKKYDLGEFELNETPKEKKYFKNVTNITLVSNVTALNAMSIYAKRHGKSATILSSQLYFPIALTLSKFKKALKPNSVVLGGGEVKLIVNKTGGKGGRNSYLPLHALKILKPQDVFLCLASDGTDNSDAAGAIICYQSKTRQKEAGLNLQKYIDNFDGYTFFKKLGNEMVFTGSTEANVADFLIWYRFKR